VPRRWEVNFNTEFTKKKEREIVRKLIPVLQLSFDRWIVR
jgi:hypothetical protein